MAVNTFLGTTNSNWGTATNWSLTAVPTASDGNVATFSNLSPACTVDASAKVCNALDFTAGTGYTNTITMSFQITSSGSVTLNAAMVIAGTGALLVNTASTLTSNGKVWPNALSLSGTTVTHTLADNWNVDGLLTLGTTSGTMTINDFQITASAGLTISLTTGIVNGSTNLILDGTGTITGSTSTGALRNNLTINTTGIITISSAQTFDYNTGTFTYTAGTVLTAGSTLVIAVSTTLNLAGITWDAFTVTGSIVTITFTSDFALTGLLSLGATSNVITLNGFTINTGGGITFGVTTGAIIGTTVINLNATGTVQAPSATTGYLKNPVIINAPGGTITFASIVLLDIAKMLVTAGTVITDSGTWAASGGGMLVHPGMTGGLRG